MSQDAIRNVVLRVRMEYVNATPKVNTDPAKTAMKDLGKTTQAAMEKAEAAAHKASEATLKGATSAIKFGHHMVLAAEGAFTLARGIAFLSTSSDEDFHRVVQNILMVQGAMDVFKGGVQTIHEVVKALHAYRAASAAAAAASAAQAAAAVAAGGAASKAGAGAAAAATALGISTGGLALLVAGIASVGAWAYNGLILGPKKAKEESDKFNASLKTTFDRLRDIAMEGQKTRQALRISSTMDVIEARANGGRNPADTRADLLREIQRSQNEVVRLQATAAAYAQGGRGGQFTRSGSTVSSASGMSMSVSGGGGLQEQEAIQRELQTQIALQEQIAAEMENQKRAAQQIVDIEKDGVKPLQDKLGELEKIRDAQRLAVDAEQKQIQMKAEIGRLSATERAELEQIAKMRLSGGQLTEAQLKRSEDLAPMHARELAERERANRAGDTSVIDRGFSVAKTEAQKILDQSQTAIDNLKKEIVDVGKFAVEEVREGWQAIVEIIKGLAPVREEIERLRQEFLQRDAQRGHN